MKSLVRAAILLLVLPTIICLPGHTAWAACSSLPTDKGTATFSINIPSTSTYRLWVHEYSPSANVNGLYAQIDPYCQLTVGDSSSIPAGQFTWIDYQNATPSNKMNLNLTAGTHTVVLAGLDSGVGVDKVLLVSDLNCVPAGQGDNCDSSSAPPQPAPPTSSTPTTGSSTPVSGIIELPKAPAGTTRTYYIDGKPVDGTKIDTSLLADGQHTLQIVQTGPDGKTQTITQKLVVSNHPTFFTHVKNTLKKPLTWIIATPCLLAIGAGVALWFTRRAWSKQQLQRLWNFVRRKPYAAQTSPQSVVVGDFTKVRGRNNKLIATVVAVGLGAVGIFALIEVFAATVTVSYTLSNATVANGASVVTNAAAIGGKMVQFAAPTSPPTPPPTDPDPPTDPTPPPSSSVPAAGSYVQPGSVGYLGSTSALTVYTSGGAAPSGCSWQSYGLRCDGDLTLDHAWLKGSLYWNGTGTLTITNSIVDGRQAWYVVYAANAGTTTATHMIIKDSTLRWDTAAAGAYPSGTDVGPIWERTTLTMDIERNDISGLPQGINPAENAVIDSNWIHDLVQNGCSSGPCHMDGIFSQGGSNILIQRNYIDAPVRSDVTAGVFFQDLGTTDNGVKVYANFIRGGQFYNLRNETSVGLDVQNNTFGNSNNAWNQAPGTIGTWTGNVHADGSSVPKP